MGPVPTLEISEKNGLHILTTLDIDIQCKKHKDDKVFWQVFTIRTKPLDMTAKVCFNFNLD